MQYKRQQPRIFRTRIIGKFCTYCGELATVEDHFPPLTTIARGFLIPSCTECNLLAGTEFPFDFKSRITVVKDKIHYRYSRISKIPRWHDDEIMELGRGLQEYVRNGSNLSIVIHNRLRWNSISYLGTIINGIQLTYFKSEYEYEIKTAHCLHCGLLYIRYNPRQLFCQEKCRIQFHKKEKIKVISKIELDLFGFPKMK